MGEIIRTGIGYDSHRFENGRKLIIGGVEIPYDKGLIGHSDADVLVHAVIDSMLGAAGLSDIGTYFPDDKEDFKNADSLKLLEKSLQLIKKEGYEIVNIDCNIIVEKPKMKEYIPEMKKKICEVIKISEKDIAIKAKTNEAMGYIGRGEGIMTMAICTLKSEI